MFLVTTIINWPIKEKLDNKMFCIPLLVRLELLFLFQTIQNLYFSGILLSYALTKNRFSRVICTSQCKLLIFSSKLIKLPRELHKEQ